MKSLVIITGSEATRHELSSQLESLLGNFVEVRSLSINAGINEQVSGDLIVLSTWLIEDEVRGYIKPGSQVILARRSLNYTKIDQLFLMPEGTEVLLVNDAEETAREVIGQLQDVGINHLRYTPWFPGCCQSKGQVVAVTPGEVDLVPPMITNIINIGSRLLDITTIVEILQRLDLLEDRASIVSAKYIENVIRLGKQLSEYAFEIKQTNSHLSKIMNQLNDGILAFDNHGRITVINEKCRQVLELRGDIGPGKEIRSIVLPPELKAFILRDNEPETILPFRGRELFVSKILMEKLGASICTIKDTKETIELEQRLRREIVKRGHVGKYEFSHIVGQSARLLQTVETARQIAKTNLSVLIYGESGTGKELFASAIHNGSRRAKGPFLAVNFSALTEDLVESELFGYEEGAFTGAKKGGKKGLFEQAAGGTIFLDEIGDISLKLQARLLRVLQEKEIMKVGGTEIIPVDVRIVAATNRDLPSLVAEGKFREDLYYRLKKLYLHIPPLRERNQDIPLLARHFLAKNDEEKLKMEPEVLAGLISHEWAGNVRELENVIEYMLAVRTGEQETIQLKHLPADFFSNTINKASDRTPAPESVLSGLAHESELIFLLNKIAEYNRKGEAIGRKRLAELSNEGPVRLTEEQVRQRTDILQKVGLIVKPKGRAGMHATRAGNELMYSLSMN